MRKTSDNNASLRIYENNSSHTRWSGRRSSSSSGDEGSLASVAGGAHPTEHNTGIMCPCSCSDYFRCCLLSHWKPQQRQQRRQKLAQAVLLSVRLDRQTRPCGISRMKMVNNTKVLGVPSPYSNFDSRFTCKQQAEIKKENIIYQK